MTKQGFGKLASLSEALNILNSLVKKKSAEKIPLSGALHRTLAEDITSPISVPHFVKSAMDGFAVIAEDTFTASQTNPKQLEIIDSITAGVISKKQLSKGKCIEITTGAPLPKGADAVVMVEYTEKTTSKGSKKLTVYKGCPPGDNTIKLGSDVKKGSVVLNKGIKLNPRLIGVLSAIGITKVPVYKKPVVAYFSTGSEIVQPGSELVGGKVYDINSATITNVIVEQNCDLIDLGLVEDDLKKIKKAVIEGTQKADFVLFSGGSSLGGEDFMVQAVAELGEVLVHGIAVKPGKPVLIGKVKGKLVLGLPGYPTSALSSFYILVVPLLHRMIGMDKKDIFVNKKLSRKIASTIGRYEFLAVKVDGEYAVPVMKGSSSITTLSESDGFLEIDENTEVLNKNEIVKVRLF